MFGEAIESEGRVVLGNTAKSVLWELVTVSRVHCELMETHTFGLGARGARTVRAVRGARELRGARGAAILLGFVSDKVLQSVDILALAF